MLPNRTLVQLARGRSLASVMCTRADTLTCSCLSRVAPHQSEQADVQTDVLLPRGPLSLQQHLRARSAASVTVMLMCCRLHQPHFQGPQTPHPPSASHKLLYFRSKAGSAQRLMRRARKVQVIILRVRGRSLPSQHPCNERRPGQLQLKLPHRAGCEWQVQERARKLLQKFSLQRQRSHSHRFKPDLYWA